MNPLHKLLSVLLSKEFLWSSKMSHSHTLTLDGAIWWAIPVAVVTVVHMCETMGHQFLKLLSNEINGE